MLEHPEIYWIEQTGYPSWLQGVDDDVDEDGLYDESRERGKGW